MLFCLWEIYQITRGLASPQRCSSQKAVEVWECAESDMYSTVIWVDIALSQLQTFFCLRSP
jgi:hypothetical protein